MTGTFILSLDCEGKWGMADHLDESHEQLTDAALIGAYERLLDVFAQYEIPVTFAFVMSFVLSREAFASFPANDPWLDHYRKDYGAGRTQGWHVPEALAAVRARNCHEVGCHGFIHRPLDGDLADEDLASARKAADLLGIDPTTLVYPRNQVGNVPLLRKHGFIGYRTRLKRPAGRLGRLISLAEEFNVRPSSQPRETAVDGVVPIPSGYFLNWLSGPRKIVPKAITGARVRGLVDHAARTGGVAHLWLHPHNILTAPQTLQSLHVALAEVARIRDAGRLQVMTQEAYCRDLLTAA